MKNVYLELTKNCSLSCVFCSLGGATGTHHKLSDMKDFLKRCHEEGFKKLFITGGEPLLHDQIEEVVSYAIKIGLGEVTVQTNGILMTKEKATQLKEAGLEQAIFSIHSHIPEMVDNLMKGKGILKKQHQGLLNAHDAGLDTPVTFVIVRPNYKILPEFTKFMVERFPFVNHYTFNFVDPVGRARGNKDLVPKISEVEPFLSRTLSFLENIGKTFRVERVPLCYMVEFSEYCTELRRIVTQEPNAIKRLIERSSYTEGYFKEEYARGDACCCCWLKNVCPGIKQTYVNIYGTEEVYPIFVKPEVIVKKAGGD